MSWGLKMRELLVQQWLLAAVVLFFMPASESQQHHSMTDLVSQSFLFSLWWKELACFGVLVPLALFVAVRIALRGTAAKRAGPDEALPEMPNGLEN
jgi:hypothetical protein